MTTAAASTDDARALALARARRRRKWDNLLRGGLLGALLMMLPLIITPYAADQYHFPKHMAAWLLLALACVWWGWGLLAGRRVRLNVTPITYALLAFYGAHVLGWLMAWRGGSSLGLATDRLAWATGALLLAFFLQDFARGRRRYLIALGWLQVMSAFATALWVLHNDFYRPENAILRLPDWRGYLSAGLGNTGHIADWIALSFPTAILFYLRLKNPAIVLALALHLTLGAAALIVCWSVHSNGGLILGSLFMLGFLLLHRRQWLLKRLKKIVFLFVVWSLVVIYYVGSIELNNIIRNPTLILIVFSMMLIIHFDQSAKRKRDLVFSAVLLLLLHTLIQFHQIHPHQPNIIEEAFGSGRWKEGGSSRLVIWGGSLSMITERPITGWGAGNFTYGYPQVQNRFVGPEHELARAVGQWTNAAHNTLMQTWAELGLVGLLALIALVWVWFGAMRSALRYGNPINDDIRLAATSMAIMGCAHSMMNFVLQLPSFWVFYAGLATLPLCLVDRNRSLKENRMEFEFDFGWIKAIVRGEGMKKVRGLAASLKLSNTWRYSIFGILILLSIINIWWIKNKLVAQVWYQKGYEQVQHLGGANAQLASYVLQGAIAYDSTLTDAYSDRAKLHYIKKDWDKLIENVNQALTRLQAPKLYFWRAEAYLRTGKELEALGDLTYVIGRTQPWLEGPELLTEANRWLSGLRTAPPGTVFAGF